MKHRNLLVTAVAGMALACTPAAPKRTNHSVGETPVTHPVRSSTLKVPGAQLYHEVRGTGPLLLIIPGGPQDAGVFSHLSQLLADSFTVVTLDPRGNSRSPFDAYPVELSVDGQADDAAALLRSLDAGAAFVFGTSGGAQIGLALAVRHPDLVRGVVAHEPPAMMLLADPSREVASARALHETWRREGVDAAMQQFFADNGLGGEGGADEGGPTFEMSPEEEATFARVSGNFEYWLAHGLLPLSLYRPDVAALRAATSRIMVGIGERSTGQPIAAMGQALADTLGVAPIAFPGDHMGFETDADAFATTLRRAFSGGR